MVWFDKLVNFLGLIAGILLVALTVLVCCDVMARYFRLFSMPWSLDFAQYGLFVITFFGAPWVLSTNGHITIDLVVERSNNCEGSSSPKTKLYYYACGHVILKG